MKNNIALFAGICAIIGLLLISFFYKENIKNDGGAELPILTYTGSSEEKEEFITEISSRYMDEGVKLSNFEIEQLLLLDNKSNVDVYNSLKKEGVKKLDNIISQKGFGVSKVGQKLIFLNLCQTYSNKGLKKFNQRFIDLSLPKEVLPEIVQEDKLSFFKDLCTKDISKVTPPSGYEEEHSYGCGVDSLYYNVIKGNLKGDYFFDNDFSDYIIEYNSEFNYNFLKDVIAGKKILETECVNYLEGY